MFSKITLQFFALVLLSFSLFSCHHDLFDDNSNDNLTVNEVVNTVNSGTWRVSYYNDSGQDETSDFSGYAFTFGNSNQLTATNGTNAYSGTWSVTDSNSNDDNPSGDDIDFNIYFSSPSNFEDLSDDWDIQQRTNNEIKLVDVSGGNGGTDYLTFTRN